MADGSLNFDTRIDLSGFMKGANTVKGQTENLKNTILIAGEHIQKAFKIDSSSFSSQAKSVKGDIDGIGQEADETGQKIAQILDNEEKSAKSKASSIAAIYRKQGMNKADAMKKAWEHIERSAGESNKKIEKSAKESSGKVRDYYEKSCSSVSAVFKKLGAMVAGFFAGRKILEAGKEAIGFASDIVEVQNVVDTAFGEMAYKMEEFADTAIETYGISKLSAKQTGSTYMAMAKGMGIASDSASNMALSLTGLSADMASFYNVSQDVASTSLKSVFTGETETLKQYGIVMTETNLQEYALSKGIKKKLSAMNQAEKVQLRYNYVMQQTTLAHGDFLNTSDTWANQTRILSERWKEFLGIIGKGLIKVLTPAIQFLNTAMSQLIAFANMAGKVISRVFGLKQSTDDVSKSAVSMGIGAEAAGTGIGEMADEAAAANKKIKGSLTGFDKLNVITQKTADNAGAAAGGIGAVGDVGGAGNISAGGIEKDNVSPMVDQAMEKLERFKNYLKTNFAPVFSEVASEIQPSIEEFKKNVSGMFSDIQTLGQPLLDYFSGDFTPALQETFLTLGVIATGLFDSFNMVFSDIWNLVLFPYLTTLTTTILPVVTGFAAEIFKTVGTLFSQIKGLFDKLWSEGIAPALGLVTKIWQDCWTSIKGFWDKWGVPIFENIRETITKLGELWQSVWDNYLTDMEYIHGGSGTAVERALETAA